MKKFVFTLLVAITFFASCKKQNKDIPDPVNQEIKITELTDVNFIQYLEIAGSEKITFDSTIQAYLVDLPAGYQTEDIAIKFKFYPGAYLTAGHSLESAELLDFAYRGRRPLTFQIASAKEQVKSYTLYVRHKGELKASIPSGDDLACDPDGNLQIPIEILSGVGTIPDAPESNIELLTILKDNAGNRQASGHYFQASSYFNDILPFVGSNDVSVELKFGSKSLLLAQKRKLLRIQTLVNYIGEYNFAMPVPISKSVELRGNGFSDKKRYSLKIENEWLAKPVTADVKFESDRKLNATLPASLPAGSYAVSIFQNDTLLNKLVTVISNEAQEKAICQIWTTQKEYPTADLKFFSARAISIERGKYLYLNSFPASFGKMYGGFDATTILPALQLKKGIDIISIKAVVKSDASFADGSIPLYYGQYNIPANIQPGSYEARIILPDQSLSLPFWTRIEIK